MKKRFLAILLTLTMVFSMTPITTFAAGADTDVAKIGEQGYGTLEEAFTAAKDGDTVILSSDYSGENDLSAIAKLNGKNVTVKGENGKPTLNVVYGQGASDVNNLHFKDLTLTINHSGYGMPYTQTLCGTYENVTINGLIAVDHGTSTFKNCVFNGTTTGDEYILWQYGGIMIVENCTFKGSGSKGIVKLYCEAGNDASNAVTGCTFEKIFTKEESAGSKECAIYSSNSNNTDKPIYELTIKDNVLPEGKTLIKASGNGISVYNATKDENGKYTSGTFLTGSTSEKVAEYIKAACAPSFEVKKNADGTYGLEEAASTAVAKIGDVEYTSLAEAVTAAKENDTIIILADSIEMPYISKQNITIQGQVNADGAPVTEVTSWAWSSEGSYKKNVGVTFKNLLMKTAVTFYGNNTTFYNCEFNGNSGATIYGDGVATIDHCLINPTNQYGIKYDSESATGHGVSEVIVKDSKIKGTVAISGDPKNISFTNCKFEGKSPSGHCNINIYKLATFTNCTFTQDYTTGSSRGILMYDPNNKNVSVLMDGCSVAEGDGTLYDVIRQDYYDHGVTAFDATADEDGKFTAGTFIGDLDTLKSRTAEGYEVEVVDETKHIYSLKEVAGSVAQIGDVEYATLAEAVATAKDGDTITIIANCNENVELNKQTIIVVNEGVDYTGDVTLAEGAEKMRLFNEDELKDVSEMYNAFFGFAPAYVVAKYPDADVQIINCDNGDVVFSAKTMDTAYSFNAFNVKNGDMAIFNKLLGEPSFAGLDPSKISFDEILSNYSSLSDDEKARVGEVLPWMLPYMMWIADFEVTFDKDVTARSMGVGGYYGSYAKEESGGLGMDIDLPNNMDSGDKYRMLYDYASMEIPYAGICLAVRTFNCGAYKLTDAIDGTTMTVSLHLYNGEEDIVIGTYDYRFPLAPVAEIGNTKYETLQAAFDAAIAGDTVKLLADVDVTEQLLVEDGKNFNLDLAGFTIKYTGETTLKSGVIGVKHGGALTIKDSSSEKTGAIKSGDKAYAAVMMTIKGDTADTKPAVLTVKGGTLEGYYYGISGNGSTGRGNTKVFVQGGTVKGTNTDDSTGIYNPQSGTLVISGGTVEGATGVYVKAGNPVTVSGGKIIGNGTKGVYQTKGDGFDSTGDGFVVDNCGYPGGAPVPAITGGTFESTNGAPIASYAKEGNTAISKFVKDGKFNQQLGDGLAAEGLEPTTSAGEDGYYTVKPEEVVAPHEHSFGVWTSDNESTHSRICECGEKEIGAHEFGAPTVSWTFPANGNVTATYSTTCSVCGKQIIKYETALLTDDSDATKDVWSATATIGGKQYTATKEVAKTYKVTVPSGFTGSGEYAYGATVKVAPNSTGVNYDFGLNGAPAAFNASSLTFKVTGNVNVTATEYVKPAEVKPVLTMAVDGGTSINKTSDGKYKVPFKISWAIEKNSGIEVIEVGYIYRYGGKDFATIDTDTVLAKGSVKTSTLKSLNGSYKCTHSFSSSYAGRNVYAIGYMTYKQGGQTKIIYTDAIGTNTPVCCAVLDK